MDVELHSALSDLSLQKLQNFIFSPTMYGIPIVPHSQVYFSFVSIISARVACWYLIGSGGFWGNFLYLLHTVLSRTDENKRILEAIKGLVLHTLLLPIFHQVLLMFLHSLPYIGPFLPFLESCSDTFYLRVKFSNLAKLQLLFLKRRCPWGQMVSRKVSPSHLHLVLVFWLSSGL